MDELRFGTDGWRDIIADRFTHRNVARVAQAYSEHLRSAGASSALVGYDTRFGGERFAAVVARVLAANGIRALLTATFVPTPVLSFGVKELSAGGAVMLTASHNPPAYNGLKIKGPYGGTATDEIYRDVGRRVAAIDDGDVRGGPADGVEEIDLRPAYFEALTRLVDLSVLRELRGTIVHDAMGGAASDWLAAAIRYAGLALEVEEIRKKPDPLFHGVNPEPLPHNLAPAIARAQEGDLLFLAATDGDGDRLGVVLPGGRFFNSHQIFAVLVDLLTKRGESGSVVKTFTVSRLIERLAHSRGLEVTETPVGFKHIVSRMLNGNVLIGGEESGGIGIGRHVPERDGIANTLLLLEAVARSGQTLDQLFAALEKETEWRHAYDRLDLELGDRSVVDAVTGALREPPATFAGKSVTSVERLDGVKLNLDDDSWLLFRASGTEPLLRVYAEAPNRDSVDSLLTQAQSFVAALSA